MNPRPCYHDDNFILNQGDCLELLGNLPAGEVSLVSADPPCSLSNGGLACQSGKRASVDKGAWDATKGIEEDFWFHTEWIRACGRVLRENSSICISGTAHSIYDCGLALQREEFRILDGICRFKSIAPPNLSCRYFSASDETFLWARGSWDEKRVFNYQVMKCGDWCEDALKRRGRQMRTVWSITTPRVFEEGQGSHLTQKPIALPTRIISACANEGDLVLDTFNGSPTTGLAACSMGRRFPGIYTEERYLEMSVRSYCDMKASGKIKGVH